MPETLLPPLNNSPTVPATAVRLCASSELMESSTGHVFDILEFGQDAIRGFVLRFEGQIVGYVNRCRHIPTELDWQPGEFLDDQKQWILCTMHGAVYDPRDGLCVAGPCASEHLERLEVKEHDDGYIYWYPSARYQAAFAEVVDGS